MLIASVIFLFCCFMAACGSSEQIDGVAPNAVDDEGLRLITNSDGFYVIGDLEAVGYKKNKQFDVDTVPGAIDIWYGFFQKRDIEVRFYKSHEAAIEFGVDLAEAVIARTAGQRDPLIPVVNLYPAYAVVGNMVMLCERELSTCDALVEFLN